MLVCDASSGGIGAVLAQREGDGSERPVGYVSRSLTTSEQKYSQLEREALAIVFAVVKFNQYLMGNQFILATDHKPLLVLFGENKGYSRYGFCSHSHQGNAFRWLYSLALFLVIAAQ